MPQTIVCTICSREKDPRRESLPACVRYRGAHIAYARRQARDQHRPFFIVSGLYGLLGEQEGVGYYDYLLDQRTLPKLVVRLTGQLVRFPIFIERIVLFAKQTPAWQPYIEALIQAAAKLKIHVEIRTLPDDA